MSVTLGFLSLPNGLFEALVGAAISCGEDVPPWNGAHDNQEYKPEHLRAIAKRIRQMAPYAEYLEMIAKQGSAFVS